MADTQQVVLSDAGAIRALAHPARLVATEALFAAAGATRTATELAREAGVTPSAMSYHLRTLERYGIVRRAEAEGDERQRPWRAAGDELVVRGSSSGSGPGGRAAVDLLVHQLLDRLSHQLSDLSARASSEPEEWRVGGLYPETAHLTAEETARLRDELSEVLQRWSRTRPGPAPGTRRVGVTVAVVPEPAGDA